MNLQKLENGNVSAFPSKEVEGHIVYILGMVL